jgi:serine/threonine-protein kinase
MLAAGDVVQGWSVVRQVHEGSLAVTYEVRREADEARYALKLMHLRDPQFQERLRRTASTLASFHHPHLVGVVATVEHEGMPGVVSRYIDGVSLDEWAAAEPRSVAQILEVVRGIADGLAAAHGQGLVHRNLKPQKVIVDGRGVPHLNDFLLGKVMGVDPSNAMTQMGTTFGTPQYMSPEQFRGAGAVDERADLFSLGCLAFEMFTGTRAFDAPNLMTIYGKIVEGDRGDLAVLRPDLPPAVVQLVDELLAPERDERPASAQAVAARLDTERPLREARGLGEEEAPAERTAGTTIAPAAGDDTLDEVLGDDVLRPPSSVPPTAEPAEAPVTEAPVEASPRADLPTPPPMTSEQQGVWLGLLGLLVVALVGAVWFAASVIGG